MSNSENICVGCKHPIVDGTIEGDMTLRVGTTCIDFKDLATGVDSKCRNCAVVFDAIVAYVGGEDRPFMQSEIWVHSSPISKELIIDADERIEVIRYSDFPRERGPPWSDVWDVKECRPLSENTSSQETICVIQEWKNNCMQHHNHCMQRKAVPLPKRILKITAEHVFLRERPGRLAPYACLSHCWGLNGPAIKLTAETAGHLRDGLRTSDLPKTFRDAVEVCRNVGIYYIWIDALCILQDSEEDWKEAAATMGDIYENSHITIAATASQDSNGGLFSSDRPVTRVKRLKKHSHLFVGRRLMRFPTRMLDNVPTSMPLLTRAWVYQERRLSHRTIHFGNHQVYWECQTGFSSEDSREDTIWNRNAVDRRDPMYIDWGDECADHEIHWQKTVMEYTALKLTYEGDRLPGIAAVVDRMSRLQRVDDVYIAGLWKNSMLSDLLWAAHANETRPVRMAPSWSWVSAQNSAISWHGYKFTREVKVVGLEYTVVGAANLGEVTNASIILMVHVLDLTGFDELDAAEKDEMRWMTRFQGISKSVPIMEQFRQNNLAISWTEFSPDYDLTTANPPFKNGCTIKFLVARNSGPYIGGIVVQQTSENPPEYKRIGFLSVKLKMMEPEIDREKTRKERAEEMEEAKARLLLSLPMKEVKIV